MVPEPQVAASEADVARTAAIAPPAQPKRRWPVLGMLAFAVGASLALWAAIFALIGLISSLFG